MQGDSSGATEVGVATTVAGASAATWSGSQQAPAFIKHVFAQLFPVMYEADVAEAVGASKGPRVLQQLHAGEAKRDVGASVVALTFNDPQKALPVPADCMHRKLKSNMHPSYRVGDKLSAKFSKASLNL